MLPTLVKKAHFHAPGLNPFFGFLDPYINRLMCNFQERPIQHFRYCIMICFPQLLNPSTERFHYREQTSPKFAFVKSNCSLSVFCIEMHRNDIVFL